MGPGSGKGGQRAGMGRGRYGAWPVSIELPGEVVTFLYFIGVNWPNVDEDQVRVFAGHVRDFAGNIASSHEAASTTIRQVGEYYSGSSYEQLVATWARMSNSHMSELREACRVVAVALEVAADAIVAAKLVAIGELVAIAASFVADQVAAVATLGAAEAAEALLIEAAKKVVNFLEQQLVQHILAEVIGRAVVPLEQVVERALNGLVFKGLEGALGVTVGGAGAGTGFGIAPAEVRRYASRLDGHAGEVAGHAVKFSAAIAGVSFGG